MQVSGGCNMTSATQTLHGQAETCRNMGSHIMTRWNFWKNCPTSLFKTVFHISQGQPWEIHSVCYLESSNNGDFFTDILFLSGRVAGHGTICCRNPLTIRVNCHNTLAVHHKKLILSRSIRTYWKKNDNANNWITITWLNLPSSSINERGITVPSVIFWPWGLDWCLSTVRAFQTSDCWNIKQHTQNKNHLCFIFDCTMLYHLLIDGI